MSRVDAPNTLSWACGTRSVDGTEPTWQAGDCAPLAARGPISGFATGHPAAGVSASSTPFAPIGLSANVGGSTVTLQWQGAVDAVSYIIEAGSAPGVTDRARFDTQSAATTVTVINVPAGEYYVRVRSRTDGGVSAPSNEATVVVTGTAACAPNAPTALSAVPSGSSVLLVWAAPPGNCAPAWYVIEAGSTPGLIDLANFSTGSAATSFSAVGVASGTYYVRVRAATAAATSGPSNEVRFTVGCLLEAPAGLVGNVNGSTVTLWWQRGSGGCAPAAYVIQAGSSPDLNDLANVSTASNATALSVTGVADGTYYVRVRASIGSDLSSASNEIVITVRTSIPCSYSFSPSSVSWTSIGGPGGTTRLSASCGWSLSTDVPWITITSPVSGASDSVVSYGVGVNSAPASRTGRIVAQGAGGTASFTVMQVGQPPPTACSTLIFQPSTQSVASGSGTYSTVLLASGPFGDPGMCSWTLWSDSPWLTITTGGGAGTGTIVFSVSANTAGARTGAIHAMVANGPQALHVVTQRAAGSLSSAGIVP